MPTQTPCIARSCDVAVIFAGLPPCLKHGPHFESQNWTLRTNS